jgi:hypothetical protein
LFGTLLAILVGLLVLGGSMAGRRPARRPPVSAEAPALIEQDLPLPPSINRFRALPSVGPDVCTPQRGWACWRGRLVLSPAVAAAWRQQRATQRADVDVTDLEQESLAEVPLPPDGTFEGLFDLHVTPFDTVEDARADEASIEESQVTLWSNGTFEIQVPPGRYVIEATSRDGLLVGGRDDVRAVAEDVQSDLEIAVGQTVAIAGRVVDEEGIAVSASLSVQRVGSNGVEVLSPSTGGHFRVDDLRAGSFRVTARTEDDQTVATTVRAPLDGLELRVTRPRDGLIVFAPDAQGKCPRGAMKLTRHEANQATPQERRLPILDCQVVVPAVPPGSSWDVVGIRGAAKFVNHVRFDFAQPLTPICMDGSCETAVAVADVWIVDGGGNRRRGTWAIVEDQGEETFLRGGSGTTEKGLTANHEITLSVTLDEVEATNRFWLRPGVNRLIVRLPVSAETYEDETTPTVGYVQ